MQSLMVLGRQPALGLAELESLYGADKVRPVGAQAAIVDVDPCLLAFDRLGGSVKFCKVLTELDTVKWKEIEKFLVQVSPGHSERMPEGKMQLGLSLYGFNENVRQIEATGLTLKKAIRKTGRSVRLTPNKEPALSSATVLHNHLTGPTGWELVFVRSGDKTVVAQTVKVQDIDSYTLRDRGRPKRDTRVGMLPPKLAQTIINLATGKLPEDKLENICEIPAGQAIPRTILGQTVLDPFCGTGVILQEALLMGYSIYGSDLEPRMVDYSKQNLEWLSPTYHLPPATYQLEQGDATTHHWQQPIDFVAAETYLGRPFTTRPTPELLAQTAADCNLIIKKFLQNIHPQLKPGTRLCLAVPAWQTGKNVFKHLPLVDQIEVIGYNRISFEHAGNEQLLYYREDQVVARELLVITRK
ncbi:MAG TPA: methyltransferase domain-containing protein [Candidatus Saccharimonadales bacterium]|nr:methyltransferase domain-containing protein [Candidatus Saccharimonadales bacterium]